MKRSKSVRRRGCKGRTGRSGGGTSWQLENLEPRVLLSTVTVSPVLVAEGNTTTNATLTARLDAASQSNIILQYATQDASAKGGLNYTPTSSYVVIPAGATSKTFTIPVLANNVYQGLTALLVNMSVSGGNKLAQRQTAVYIQDNDAAPEVLMHDVAVAGSNKTQTVNVPVTLTSLSLVPVTVTYGTYNVTAAAGTDYRAASGKVTFAPGEWYKTIPVQVAASSGGDKAFGVLLGTATNATLGAQWVYSRVAIQNGSASAKPTVTVDSTSVEAGGYEQFHVSLSHATTQDVSFRYRSYAPTAGGGTITPVDNTFTIAAGSTTGTIYVRTQAGTGTADADFPLALSAPANATLAAPAAWGKIVSVPPSLSVADTSVLEGDTGTSTMTFTVTLSSASTQAVTVDYATADGTAVAGTDYTPANGTLTFAPGQVSKAIDVSVTGNVSVGAKTFNLTLSNASSATVGTATAVGTINYSNLVLSDNFAAPDLAPEYVNSIFFLAASFSTGSSGLSLTSVTIPLREIAPGGALMSLYSDSSGLPGASVGTLASPGSYSPTSANTVFTAGGISLTANTTYWLVMQAPVGTYGWMMANSNDGTGAGFTAGSAISSNSGTTWNGFSTLKMQVVVST